MKDWADDHPKAKLMGRNRAAILEAARSAFLSVGYEGASMDAIAQGAGVSIMTLYRHAPSKDDLFETVILNACNHAQHDDGERTAALLEQPLSDLLVTIGDLFQAKMSSDDTLALFRAVIVEMRRFPHLAQAACSGLVEAWSVNLDALLAAKPELSAVAGDARREMLAEFFDGLVGTDILRTLLGTPKLPVEQQKIRSRTAADKFVMAATRCGLVQG
ncbi:TetR/AcrR family transcriptional regulator [Lichenihabitans sp. Uapishka_5]|uniref:TetR/AcrR family transcriptional regulator n=1 Tax=Lichenihabitans sp. Uapishka_5 TaxID=3037302 RepID=UPI0029E80DA8|nr:TetR/AcrR family transcriptional regulator [Lichenihabitans sp. Uapishka_5]MDX7950859.1 TetR/AcrR family transcriptional regulator [Lichenihabitans sp. Uapishka_5]